MEAEFRPLDAILTIPQAIAAQSYHSGPFHIGRQDASSAIAASHHRLNGELSIGGQEHFYLETQCALSRLDESDGIVVDSSTQHPAETQEIVARVLGIPRSQTGRSTTFVLP